jgi:molybdate/tungstate transport system substrate-binding protein
LLLAIAALLLAVCAVSACSHVATHTVSAVDADSLIVPFASLAQAYESAHPDVRVETESHGSIQVIRQVTDLGRSFDVLTSADAGLVALMMEGESGGEAGGATATPATATPAAATATPAAATATPAAATATSVAPSAKPTADWYAIFATNRMVLAYSPHSRYAALFRSGDWIKALTTPGVQFGLADPRFDATGYRALMVLQLAQRYYHDDHLFADVTVGRLSPPITVTLHAVSAGSTGSAASAASAASTDSAGVDLIDVPELLDGVSGSGLVLRGASIELMALLESGDLDCAFEYESVVRQHHLPFVQLPAQIDLSSQRYAANYAKVAVSIAFQRFATVKPVFVGAPIAYAVTIPSTAHDPADAARFIAFLLGPRGRAILAADYQPAVTPALVDHFDKLPAVLRPLCAPLKQGQTP